MRMSTPQAKKVPPDIRYSRKPTDQASDDPRYELSKGQILKKFADITRMKVYTRVVAEATIDAIVREKLGMEDIFSVFFQL